MNNEGKNKMNKPERNSMIITILVVVICTAVLIGYVAWVVGSLRHSVNLNTCTSIAVSDPQFIELKCKEMR